ncbi:MAG: hypothetical protein Q7S55_05130 [Nanoarchaeota archaeon]|nr:hypothetical protein [Nanoarchaeota archaeon]
MPARTDYESIFERIGDLNRQIEEIMPSVRESIDEIINNNITSTAAIEQVLDRLLDFASLGLGEAEFRKLNKYYVGINKNNANFYERQFEDLQRED